VMSWHPKPGFTDVSRNPHATTVKRFLPLRKGLPKLKGTPPKGDSGEMMPE
jgi:hypothetical protein